MTVNLVPYKITEGSTYQVPEKFNNALDDLQAEMNAILAVVGSGTYQGEHDASTGSYPAGPTAGDEWLITTAGTISGTYYKAGERIMYSGSAWFKINQLFDQDLNTTDSPTFAGFTLTGSLVFNYANPVIAGGDADGVLQITPATAGNGANILFYGQSHATLANDFKFRYGTTDVLHYDYSAGTLTFSQGRIHDSLGDVRNIPAVGQKTSSYNLAVADVGKYVEVGAGGSITIPDATFSQGNVITIWNNTTGDITITCSITTAYIAGEDADKASVTLATRGLCTILFHSGTVCVMSGNIS